MSSRSAADSPIVILGDDELAAAVDAKYRECGAKVLRLAAGDADAVKTESQIRQMGCIRRFVASIPEASDTPGLRTAESFVERVWPAVNMLQKIIETAKAPPASVVWLTQGRRSVESAVLDTLCRYIAVDLHAEQVTVNMIHANLLRSSVTPDTAREIERQFGDGIFIDPAEVAMAVFGLTSGLMDSVNGQMITLTRGYPMAETFLNRIGSDRRSHWLGSEATTC